MTVLQCVWLYSSVVKQAYIRMMARSLWFLPTFYNFPREMLCASGPNLQKQFKHQRLLLLLSCFVAELPVFFYFSATYLRAKAAKYLHCRQSQTSD